MFVKYKILIYVLFALIIYINCIILKKLNLLNHIQIICKYLFIEKIVLFLLHLLHY